MAKPGLPFLSEITCSRPAPDQVKIFGRYDLSQFTCDLYDKNAIPFPDRFIRAVAKRQGEYLAGRMLAQRAVKALGGSGVVTRGGQGEPLWPGGLHGSISHSSGRVGVWATAAGWHPGLDVEHLVSEAEAEAIRAGVLTDGERNMALSIADLTAVFSAKEALFKGLFPVVQRRFGFTAATLFAPPEPSRLQLVLSRALAAGLERGRVFDIALKWHADRVESTFKGHL